MVPPVDVSLKIEPYPTVSAALIAIYHCFTRLFSDLLFAYIRDGSMMYTVKPVFKGHLNIQEMK